MSERLTQKQIKQDIREDEVQSFLITAIEKFQQRPSFYIGIVVGVLVLGAAITAGVGFMAAQKETQSDELAQAIRVFNAEVGEDAKPDDPINPSFATEDEKLTRTRAALEEVGGGVAGDVADLYRARLAFEAGDVETARQIWEDFLDDYSEHALAVSVQVNLIRLDREQGKAEEVAARLEDQLENKSSNLPEDLLIFELAKTRQMLGQDEAAADLYQRILDEFPTSGFAAEARQQTTAS